MAKLKFDKFKIKVQLFLYLRFLIGYYNLMVKIFICDIKNVSSNLTSDLFNGIWRKW